VTFPRGFLFALAWLCGSLHAAGVVVVHAGHVIDV